MGPLLAALLAAASPTVDGGAALRHAAALSSLGPHPWGSTRGRAAAAYVAAQLRGQGIADVRLQEFEAAGIHGTNVLGVLPGPGRAFVLLGAHHDSAPEAPGAYDDGGGVGVVLEVARVIAARRERPVTFVFASFDGEEAWSTGKATTSGSRAYVKSLGVDARDLVAAFVVEMSGWRGGTPVLHPIPYADPLRGDAAVVAPAWVVSASLSGARRAGEPFGVGDPWISWLYQPAVRTFRGRLYGDDLSFLQAGLPAVFASDSSFTAFYPWYHQATDTADRLDPAALARMGRATLGAVDGLAAARRGGPEPSWLAVLGHVVPGAMVVFVGALALVARLARAAAAPARARALRLAQAVLIAVLLWRHPVPALWVFLLPLALTAITRAGWARVAGLLPAVALGGLGAAAASRGMIRGTWLAWWEIATAVLALALFFVPLSAGSAAVPRPRGRR